MNGRKGQGISMHDDCIFCKIATNQLPSYTIYENDNFKIILDRFPWAAGHTLIVIKRHAETIFELTPCEGAELFRLAVIAAKALNEVLNPDGLNVLQNNKEAAVQSINHFHMHLIPRYKNDSIGITFKQGDPPSGEFEKLLADIKNKFNLQ